MKIALLGPGGIGKSTIIKYLKDFLEENNYKIFDERPILLKRRYKRYMDDQRASAFKMQKYFFKQRYKTHKKMFNYENSIIDRDILDDFLYPRIHIELNNFSETEKKVWKIIDKKYKDKLENFPKVDLSIVIVNKFDKNYSWILQRSLKDESRKLESKGENKMFFRIANKSYWNYKKDIPEISRFSKKIMFIVNENSKKTSEKISKIIDEQSKKS